jgi:hypothetical protein
VTDEDPAFIPAFELFETDRELHERPRHDLGALHKEGNFRKKLTTCGLRRVVKA